MPDSPLPKVRFHFSAETDTFAWRVVTLHAREAISELYALSVELACDDPNADPDTLLGEKCEVLVSRDAHERAWRGIVHRVEHRGVAHGHVICRAHLVPALYAMSQRVDSYIFQDMTVPQILAIVLAEGLSPYGRTYSIDHLTRDYPTREYCVQYRETDLEFVLRLMADEGISFWFDHSGAAELMVLADTRDAPEPIATMDGNPVGIQGPESGTATAERVRHFELAHSLQSTSSVVRDFDWTRPSLGIPGNGLSAEQRSTDLRGRDREVYEYPAPLTIGDYSAPRYAAHDAVAQAAVRQERFASNVQRFTGGGEVTVFTPGMTFELTGHRVSGFDGRYLLTRVEHFGFAPEELTPDVTPAEAQRERYHNSFDAIDATLEHRPSRTVRRPVIAGTQTATVVGPTDEEIYTDEHGRIKVQFHWDRFGGRDAQSSLWIRVAQTWSGAGWGFMFIPRIGMEVVVTFLEGNPDRPLVTGCVYNGENTPSYTLPDEKTKSWIRTNSSHTTGGYNELRFEDLADSEEVYLRAQKDFNELVRNNHSTTVNANQTNTVHGKQTETVDKDKSITVHKNRDTTIDGDDYLHVKGNRTIVVDGQSGGPYPAPAPGAGLKVTGTYTVEATQMIKLFVGASSIVIDGGSITLRAGGGAALRLDANAHLRANAGGDLFLDANAHLHANPGGDLFLDANAHLHANPGGDLFLDANAHLHANGGGDLYLPGDAHLHANGGGDLYLNANANLGGGQAQVHSTGAAVTLDANATVTGALVKLNP
jgi:type VI secretion system secreted protein VgrG